MYCSFYLLCSSDIVNLNLVLAILRLGCHGMIKEKKTYFNSSNNNNNKKRIALLLQNLDGWELGEKRMIFVLKKLDAFDMWQFLRYARLPSTAQILPL